MKKILFLFFILLLTQHIAVAQNAKASAGKTASSASYSVSYTIGQPFTRTLPTSCLRVFEGVQQPIGHNNSTEFSVQACDSYTWEGVTYTESGDYTRTLTNSQGCEGVFTLHLTILRSSNSIQGATQSLFSVSGTKKVRFSPGNLQFQASTHTWRFAEHQYDYIGTGNNNISSTYSGWIDLFGYGCSGWNSGADAYNPWSASTDYTRYVPAGSYSNELTGNYADADWAWHNAISGGGNVAHQWRTMTSAEWNYLLNGREGAASKHGIATVGSVHGMVILPDTWVLPTGLTFVSGEESWSSNIYTTAQWAMMEAAGAVFLPAAGYRWGAGTEQAGDYGYYYTVSNQGDYYSVRLRFGENMTNISGQSRILGFSIRPVYDVNSDVDVAACDSYTWDGTTYTASGSHESHFANMVGCDSVAFLNLTILHSNTGIDNQTHCDFYTWIDGNRYSESNNSATHTLTNAVGCDSIVTLHLTINRSSNTIQGATQSLFSVSDERTVRFSPGNLQFRTNTRTWRFAQHQYDYIGAGNNNISSTYSGWIDLFGYGCSGWNSGATTFNPWASNTYNERYNPGGSYSNDLTGDYADADWAWHNAILGGGNVAHQWRTMTSAEWDYLLNGRDGAANKHGIATVNTVHGLVILPDTWVMPTGLTFVPSTESWSSNTYTTAQWAMMEAAGAVFLPAAGYRYGTEAAQVGTDGYYWTVSNYGYNATRFRFGENMVNISGQSRILGFSIRPVYDVNSETNVAACDSYTWIDGNTYTESTVSMGTQMPSVTLTNMLGCDSLVTLHLTVNHSSSSTIFDTVSVVNLPRLYGGDSHFQSVTDSIYTFTATNGCDSVVHYNLYVNHPMVTIYPDNVSTMSCTFPVDSNNFNMRELFSCSGVNSMSTPMVADMDGDGFPEIIACKNTENSLWNSPWFSKDLLVFDGQTGALKNTITTAEYRIHGQCITIADADRDGSPEFFLLDKSGFLHCYNSSGSQRWSNGTLAIGWNYLLTVADIMGDSIPELVCGNYIFNAEDGTLLLNGSMRRSGRGFGAPHGYNSDNLTPYYMYALADIDGDGSLELCAGNSIYKIIITNHNGTTGNSWSTLRQVENNAAIDNYDGQTFITDFDGDGDMDICVIGTDSLAIRQSSTHHTVYPYVWDGQTSEIIAYSNIGVTNQYGPSIPFSGDLDGNGTPEIIFSIYNMAMYAYTFDDSQLGNMRLMHSHPSFGETSGFTVFDFNQDDHNEIVYRGTTNMFIVDGITLDTLCTPISSYSGTIAEYPVVADVNADGHAEIIIARSPNPWLGSGSSNGYISVYGSNTPGAWSSARKVWNQWAYSSVNINEDLTIPQYRFDVASRFPNGKQPFNSFLRQMPYINSNGDMFTPAVDVEAITQTSSPVMDGDTVRITVEYFNQGDADLQAPYGITIYKNDYHDNILWIDTVTQVLAHTSTQTTTHSISIPRSIICSLAENDRLVIALNDLGTGIAQHGGQQPECDTTNNTVEIATPVYHNTGDATATVCDSYSWFEHTDITESTEALTHNFTNSFGCDSTVTLHLTVNHSNTNTIQGATRSLFSVSSTHRVRFSPGNLQFQASTGTWRFAEQQYDYLGIENQNISPSYDGWIDLFGYGTSGWAESGASAWQPWSTIDNNPSYYLEAMRPTP